MQGGVRVRPFLTLQTMDVFDCYGNGFALIILLIQADKRVGSSL